MKAVKKIIVFVIIGWLLGITVFVLRSNDNSITEEKEQEEINVRPKLDYNIVYKDRYEYPVFETSNLILDDVVEKLNKNYEEAYAEAEEYYGEGNLIQIIRDVSIEYLGDMIFIKVDKARCVYDNYYFVHYSDRYAMNIKEADFVKLKLTDKKMKEICWKVYDKHSDMDRDLLFRDIELAIKKNHVKWEERGRHIDVWFDPSDIRGGKLSEGVFGTSIFWYGYDENKEDAGDLKIDYMIATNEGIEYPVFETSNLILDDVVEKLNKRYVPNLNDRDEVFIYNVSDISIEYDEQFIFINVVIRENRGDMGYTGISHESYAIDTEKAKFVELSDVIDLTESQVNEICEQIYSQHPECQRDNLFECVKASIEYDSAKWKKEGNKLIVGVDPHGIRDATANQDDFYAEIELKPENMK